MMIYFGELLVMTLLGSVASLFLKRASGEAGIIAMLKNINLYVGGFIYLLSAVINIWVLKWLDYSVVLPLTSLTYIWTMTLAYLILKEKITRGKFIGNLIIIAGIIVYTL